MESLGSIINIFVSIVGVFIVFLLFFNYFNALNIFRITRMLKTWKPSLNFLPPNFMGMCGKTKEQKIFINYFGKNGIINIVLLFFCGSLTLGVMGGALSIFGMIYLKINGINIMNGISNDINIIVWAIICVLVLLALDIGSIYFYMKFFKKMSNTAFDELLNSKADEFASKMEDRALEAHGMDVDEVKEIPPILIENYYPKSRYFKMFKDNTFRASEYQMSYLMFSDKQLYAYSYIFDLTSDNTTEQTKEYFYEDITTMDVSKKQTEFPYFRLAKKYIIGGIACLVVGLLIINFQVRLKSQVNNQKQEQLNYEMNSYEHNYQLYEQNQITYQLNEQIYQQNQDQIRQMMNTNRNQQGYEEYQKEYKKNEQEYKKEQAQVRQIMDKYEQDHQNYEYYQQLIQKNDQTFGKQRLGAIIFSIFFGVAGLFILVFAFWQAFSRRLVDSLILRLTVSNDEFVCTMKPENMAAIQGMKSKIREKKV